jgi:hypothetical protein
MSLNVARARFFAIWRMLDSDIGARIVLAVRCLQVGTFISYSEIPPRWALPVISLSHASAHSRTISVAYLSRWS